MKTKKLAVLTICVLLLVGSIGATLAWLTDYTQTVTNTFTVGNVEIVLTEDGASDTNQDELDDSQSFKMIPGFTIAKEPKVAVVDGSEDCWLFVEISKSDNYSTYLNDYTVADGWSQLQDADDNDVAGVFYRSVMANAEDKVFYILGGKTGFENGYVVVKDTVKKGQMDVLTDDTLPTLTFKAYASQYFKANNTPFDPYEAWKEIKGI